MLKENNYKQYILIFLFILFFMVLCTVYETNIISTVKEYVLNYNNNENFLQGLQQKILTTVGNFELKFDYIIIWATNIFQLLLPFAAILFSIKYLRDKNTSICAKNIVNYSFKISITIFLAYLVFYLLIIIICQGRYTTYITQNLFSDILGTDFYAKNIHIYYILEGMLKFLLAPFIYISSAIFLSLTTNNKHLLYYYIIVFYFCLSYVSSALSSLGYSMFIYISPMSIMIPGSYVEISTFLLLIFNMLIFIFSFLRFKRKKEKYYD